MTKANEKVREAAKSQGVPLWRIAAQMGVSEPTMIRWLRLPLNPEKEKTIMEAIEVIAKEGR